jgi:hypothetical protein
MSKQAAERTAKTTRKAKSQGAKSLSPAEARLMAMGHEDRRKILRHIRDHGPIAAVEVRDALRLDMSTAGYHCRVLRELGCVEVVKTEPVRGSVKKWLVATERHIVEDPEWEQLDPVAREGVLISVFQPTVDDFERGIKDETIGQKATDFHVTREPLKAMDAEGFEELRAAHHRLFEETSEIARRAAERMAATGEKPISVSSNQQCFRVESF